MGITVIAKILAVVREAVQANVFGSADSLYYAYNNTIYLFTTLSYAMSIAAVPIITKALDSDRKKGERVANNLTGISLLFGGLAMLLWITSTIPPIASFFWPNQDVVFLNLLRIMSLSLPLIALTYIRVAIFQSMDHYSLQGFLSLPFSAFLIIVLLSFSDKLPLEIYAIAIVFAWLLQLLITVPCSIQEKFKYKFTLDFKQPYVRLFTKASVIAIITNSTYLFCYLTDTFFASGLGAGWITAFYYSDKLYVPLVSTFIYSIGIVLFPKLSRQYKQSEEREYLQYVWKIVSTTLVAVLPICSLMIVFGNEMITVLFESGYFTTTDASMTGSIFIAYAFGMAGFCIFDLLNKAFYSMERFKEPVIVSIGVIAVNVLLDIVFLSSGKCLASCTVFSLSAGAVIMLLLMFKGNSVVKFESLIKSAIATIPCVFIAIFLKFIWISGDETKLLLTSKCLTVGIIFLAVYFLVCWILKLDEIRNLFTRRKEIEQ